MIEIIPAILPLSLEDLQAHLAQIQGVASSVQIDIVDGRLAPNKTWPYGPQQEALNLPEEAVRLPLGEHFDFQIDLMVQDPGRMALAWLRAGASGVIVHAGARGAEETLRALKSEQGASTENPEAVFAVALPCDAPVSAFDAFENLCDFVQVMGIEKIGFQGELFDPRALKLVRALRQQYPVLTIQVDGGVGEANIHALAEAGASRLVVGSVLWKSEDPGAQIERLQKMLL